MRAHKHSRARAIAAASVRPHAQGHALPPAALPAGAPPRTPPPRAHLLARPQPRQPARAHGARPRAQQQRAGPRTGAQLHVAQRLDACGRQRQLQALGRKAAAGAWGREGGKVGPECA
jgi:hypothetical protein